MPLGNRTGSYVLFKSTAARYAFGVASVAAAFGLRLLLTSLTGQGAPFVLFFAATLVTSLLVGVGPAVLALAISLPVAVMAFVIPAGYSVSQAITQSALYAADALLVIYLMMLITRRSRMTREVIELANDAYLQSDLNGRYVDVNDAACRLVGYERDELIGMRILDIIIPEEAERLKAVRAELEAHGKVVTAEWTVRRKDGTLVPVEVSANLLSDGRGQAFIRDISERKRIEDQRQVFVSLLDNSSDFIGIADPDGKPIYLNDAGRRMIGLEPDYPVEQLEIQDCYPPEIRGFVTDVILKTMLEQGLWRGETEFLNLRTGEKIPVSDTHFLIRDASGDRVLGMGTVTRDMSEARRITEEREHLLAHEQHALRQAETANAQLREAEERFRLTIDNAPIGMALVALDGRWVRVNQVLCEITGYSADELMKLTFQDITHRDDLDKDVDLTGRLARGEIPRYQLEKRYIRKDRSVVDVMLSVSVLRGTDGAARYYISQVEDITARKRAAEAVRLSEAKFSGIVSIATDAIISVDKDQRITVFNEGAESIFGYPKEEAIGMLLHRLIPERFHAAHGDHFAGFARGDETARTMGERREIFGLRKNGEEFHAEASISKVSVGQSPFFSVVLRDVTDRKRAEEALQRALTARDEVLGIVAHDLRNPLSTILMSAALLERPEPEPERRDQKPRLIITRSAKRMNALIQDLLDVAVVEAGQLKVEHERIPAADIARDAVEASSAVAASSSVELLLDVAPGVREVWGDRNRLLQVFDNLIGNALKFTKEGGRVTVRAEVRDQEVVFSVADTGAGIAPENLSHVFDRFWQAATRVRGLGAGLGLPITKGIIEAHGGRIWADSVVERGSTFSFSIPVAPAPSDPPSTRSGDRRHTQRRSAV